MNKLLTALLAAAFAASPVLAQTTAPAKDEKKVEAKKEAAPAKAEAKKAEPAKAEAKKEEAKKKPKGGC